jgi:hypothetical protein
MPNDELRLLEQELGRRWFRRSEAQRLDLAVDFLQRGYELGLAHQSGWDFVIQDDTPDDRSPDRGDTA